MECSCCFCNSASIEVVTTGSVITAVVVVVAAAAAVEILVASTVDFTILFSSLDQLNSFFSPNNATDNNISNNECNITIHKLT